MLNTQLAITDATNQSGNENETPTCHIIILHSKLRQRSEDRYLVDAALALREAGHKATFYTTEFDQDNSMDPVHPIKGNFPVFEVGRWIPDSVFGWFRRTLMRIRVMWMAFMLIVNPPEPKPNIVILDTEPIALPLFAWFSTYKTFYVRHFPELANGDIFHCNMRITTDLLTVKTIGYADEIIVQTKCLQDIFRRSFPKVTLNTSILTPCYDTGLWKENVIDVHRIVPDLPEDFQLFVAFGSFKKRSNFRLLLDALEHMFSFMKSPLKEKIHMVIAGRCSDSSPDQQLYYNDLIDLAKEKPYASQITFLKQLPTIHKKTLIQACTAVVHPTRHDAYPGPILAAMGLGRPIIAVNCGFASGVLMHRLSGILVEPDPYKFAKVMYKLATSPTLQTFLGDMGRNNFLSHYSFEHFSNKLGELVAKHVPLPKNEILITELAENL